MLEHWQIAFSYTCFIWYWSCHKKWNNTFADKFLKIPWTNFNWLQIFQVKCTFPRKTNELIDACQYIRINYFYYIYVDMHISILGVGIIGIDYVINAINVASRLTQLYSSYRLMFSLSFKKKLVVLAQLEAKIQSIKVKVV